MTHYDGCLIQMSSNELDGKASDLDSNGDGNDQDSFEVLC